MLNTKNIEEKRRMLKRSKKKYRMMKTSIDNNTEKDVENVNK